jgi:iron(III) transport system ATP-binding protein
MGSFDAKQDSATVGSDWGPRGTAAATFAARLSFESVTHLYGDVEAVRDVSLELAPGEIVCLLGPSGCGKTTLLRIAAGVERPQTGRILLNGREIAGPGTFVPPERRNVGLMFQDFALFPHLTILDNVMFGLRNLERADALSEAQAALRRVGMSSYEKSYPHVLSGGEQQRVALARAIVPRPAVMLMDEPFSGLDQRLREVVREETLAILRETRASCLMVTHDPAEAMWMADRIAVMHQGRLIQSGTPAEVYSTPVDIGTAKFFCDFNELKATARAGKVSTPLGEFTADADQADGPVVVMIRPQGIVPATGKAARQGTVLDARFLGDASLLTLGVHGCDIPVKARLSGGIEPQKGATMRFKIDLDHVLIFPALSAVANGATAGYQD